MFLSSRSWQSKGICVWIYSLMLQLGVHNSELLPWCAEHLDWREVWVSRKASPTFFLPSLPYSFLSGKVSDTRTPLSPKETVRQKKVLPSTSSRSQSVSRTLSLGKECCTEGQGVPSGSYHQSITLLPSHISPQWLDSWLKRVFISEGCHTMKTLLNRFAMLLSF